MMLAVFTITETEIENEYGTIAAVMSGTSSGWERPYMAFVDNVGDSPMELMVLFDC